MVFIQNCAYKTKCNVQDNNITFYIIVIQLFEVSTSTTIVIFTLKLNLTSTNKSIHNLINLDLKWMRFWFINMLYKHGFIYILPLIM